MKKYNYSTILFYTLIAFALFLLGEFAGERNADKYIDFEVPTDIIKTVAHVDVDTPNLELIYEDADEDIAYYRFIGLRDIINTGDTVYLYDGTEYIVTSTSINGFNIRSETVAIMGLSGMAVLDAEGNQVGYVSQLLLTGEVYCIWS